MAVRSVPGWPAGVCPICKKEHFERSIRGQVKKGREKMQDKQEERQQRSVTVITWASVLIWVGLVLLVDNLGLVPALRPFRIWPVILMGMGAIVIIGALARLAIPSYRRRVGGGLIPGIILLAIGVGGLWGWNMLWPIVLITIGLIILFSGLVRR